MPCCPNAPEFAIEDMMTRMNIQTIPYDPVDNHKEVFETLNKLSARLSLQLMSKRTLTIAPRLASRIDKLWVFAAHQPDSPCLGWVNS